MKIFRSVIKILLYFLLACSVILLVGSSPWFFSQPCTAICFDQYSAFVGDTIGGITAPIVGLIGAVLVYFALEEQIKANQTINDQLRKQREDELFRKMSDYISNQIDLIRKDIDDFEFTPFTGGIVNPYNTPPITYKGSQAINSVLYDVSKTPPEDTEQETVESHFFLKRIIVLLNRIVYLLNRCEQANLKKEDADYLRSLILYVYEYNLKTALREYEVYRASNSDPYRSIPEMVYTLYDRINEKIDPIWGD